MMVVISKKKTGIDEYRSDDDITPMFIKGNSLDVLKAMPDKSIDISESFTISKLTLSISIC